jgi:signal transduction histidine kinase
MPVMALVILLSLRHALKPLKTLTRTLGERSPSELDPLPVDKVPEEVQPLVRGFNALMARLENAFQQQKRFIADAAHELKTPLAALQIHTENALAEDGEARTTALLHVKEGIVRTNRLVEQLLLLSRLEHLRQPGPQQSAPKATLELGQATRQLFAELAVLAERRQQRLLLECPMPQTISGNELVLRALLRNLLDNALRYSPAGSDVSVQIFRDDSGLCWRVCDQGPGISTDQQEQVFEPFFRELGNEATGSGLGLAIAREAAMQLGASISLSSNSPSGLCVSVRWST